MFYLAGRLPDVHAYVKKWDLGREGRLWRHVSSPRDLMGIQGYKRDIHKMNIFTIIQRPGDEGDYSDLAMTAIERGF